MKRLLGLIIAASLTVFIITLMNCGKQISTAPVNNNSNNHDTTSVDTSHVYILTSSLPDAQKGESYHYTMRAQDGEEPYRWSITEERLPEGLELTTTGIIQGIPTRAEIRTFVIKVIDDRSDSVFKKFSLTVRNDWEGLEGKIVYIKGEGANQDIYMYDLGIQTETNLTNNPGTYCRPAGSGQDDFAWSPRGNKLAYVRNHRIHIMDVNIGLDIEAVEEYSQWTSIKLAWSPDETKLVYHVENDISNNLSILNVSNGNSELFYEGNSYIGELSWSPDGSSILFAQYVSYNSSKRKTLFHICFDIMKISYPNGTRVNLSGNTEYENEERPKYSPAGKIAYFYSEYTPWGPDWGSVGNFRLYVREGNWSNPRLIAEDGYAYYNYNWSSNGTKLAHGKYCIIISESNGTEIYRGPYETINGLSWSPNSQWIAYRNDSGILKILAMETGTIKEVSSDLNSYPLWRPRE